MEEVNSSNTGMTNLRPEQYISRYNNFNNMGPLRIIENMMKYEPQHTFVFHPNPVPRLIAEPYNKLPSSTNLNRVRILPEPRYSDSPEIIHESLRPVNNVSSYVNLNTERILFQQRHSDSPPIIPIQESLDLVNNWPPW